MHSSLLLRYAAAAAPSRPSKAVSDLSKALLPPLPLYRRVLRVHRGLPLEMRSLGDAYVRSEFRLHKSTDNPIHIVGFLQQWKMYLELLEDQAAKEGLTNGIRGKKMDLDEYEKLSEEQIGQLYELMHATQEIWKSPEEIAAEKAPAAGDILGGSSRKE